MIFLKFYFHYAMNVKDLVVGFCLFTFDILVHFKDVISSMNTGP